MKKSNNPSTGLSGTQFSTLKSAGIDDHGGPEKYNNTEVLNLTRTAKHYSTLT
jgi:hypothetical protein